MSQEDTARLARRVTAYEKEYERVLNSPDGAAPIWPSWLAERRDAYEEAAPAISRAYLDLLEKNKQLEDKVYELEDYAGSLEEDIQNREEMERS